MRSRRPGSRLALAFAGLLLIPVTACSGGSPETNANGGGCDTPGVTADGIKLGFVYPDTGPGSEAFVAARAGVDARIGAVNENGGINGRKISYVWRDDEASLESGLRVARDLVENEQVTGLVMASVTAGLAAPYLAEQRVPVTGLDAEPVWSQYDNMFAFVHPTNSAVDTWGKYIQKNGGTRAVIIHPRLGSAVEFGRQLASSMTAAGVENAGNLEFTVGVDSPDRVARDLRDLNADAVVSVLEPGALAEIVGAIRRNNVPLRVTLSVTGYDATLLHRLGSGLAGVSIALHYHPIEAGGPAVDQYLGAMTRYAPQVQEPAQEFAIMSYIQTDMMLRALADAGPCPTRDSIITALENTKDYNAGGLIQPTDLGAGGDQPQTCLAFVRVNNAGTAFDVTEKELCGSALAP